MSSPMLTVTMPIYNVERYIRRAIESILGQKFKDFELILVDDGSTDCSGKICDEYALIDKRVKVIHQKNKGLMVAREVAIEIAKGKYIGFVDSDDWIEINMYNELISIAEQYQADIVAGLYVIEENGNIRKDVNIRQICSFSQDEMLTELFKMETFSWNLWDKIYKRSVLLGKRLPDDIVCGEDLLINWEIMKKSNLMVCAPLYMYHYCRHSGSVTTIGYNTGRASMIQVLKMIELEIEKYDAKIQSAFLSAVRIRIIGALASITIDGNKEFIDLYLELREDVKKNIFKYLSDDKLSILRKSLALYFYMPKVLIGLLKPVLKLGGLVIRD